MISRRAFIRSSSAALAGMTCLDAFARSATTGPFGLPIGIQLYTVRAETAKDLVGTLNKLGAIGYREVEMAGYYDRSAQDLKALLDGAGLAAPSAHQGLTDLLVDTQKKIEFVAQLGVKNIVIPFPSVPDDRFAKLPKGSKQTIANSMTLADWKWIAENLNKIGAITKQVGMRTGYHNHNLEFRTIDGVVAFDKLLEWTDPELVTIELDLGWVVAAGLDPVAMVKKHARRVSMLHVKDVKPGGAPVVDVVEADTAEVGNGKVDWKAVFGAMDRKQITHYFVEQENFDRPIMDAVKISHDYLSQLRV
jgi:sugar phosphate isomerase/epimerase